ncbi:hypothetical protein BJY17_002582 [Agromyces hippuratus]|uniref:Uncharacterized protein n=1 Tax=Agromyces hippuratus TaxID=286438 RepID=A0A852X7D3_9MICO|nr:hypothetical protein [Agromyces hippuratus]
MGPAGSAALQLFINLVAIITGGVLTLSVQLEVQRRAYRRRQRRLTTPAPGR